jgi:hypothetical protein
LQFQSLCLILTGRNRKRHGRQALSVWLRVPPKARDRVCRPPFLRKSRRLIDSLSGLGVWPMPRLASRDLFWLYGAWRNWPRLDSRHVFYTRPLASYRDAAERWRRRYAVSSHPRALRSALKLSVINGHQPVPASGHRTIPRPNISRSFRLPNQAEKRNRFSGRSSSDSDQLAVRVKRRELGKGLCVNQGKDQASDRSQP